MKKKKKVTAGIKTLKSSYQAKIQDQFKEHYKNIGLRVG